MDNVDQMISYSTNLLIYIVRRIEVMSKHGAEFRNGPCDEKYPGCDKIYGDEVLKRFNYSFYADELKRREK